MSGKTRKQQNNQLDESQIEAWLKNRPDFFMHYPDCLSLMELPDDSGSAISLHQYQVRVLRDEKAQLTQKLGVLVKNVKTNHKIHSDLLGLAGNMIQLAKTRAKISEYLLLIKQNFALFDVKLLEKADDPDHFKQLKSVIGKRDSACDNKPDEDLRKMLFGGDASKVSSIAIVAVKQGKNCRAYLVLASDDEERFKPGMGGEFLKLLAQLVSRLLTDAKV